MKNIPVTIALIGILFLFAQTPAQAHDDPKMPASKKAHKEKDCDLKKHDKMMQNEAMHEMMLETHDIMLETIYLVQKTVMDEDTGRRAEELSRRLENLIRKHKEMHATMMGGMDGGGMSGHEKEMKMERMEHMGHKDKKEHKEMKEQMEKSKNSQEY